MLANKEVKSTITTIKDYMAAQMLIHEAQHIEWSAFNAQGDTLMELRQAVYSYQSDMALDLRETFGAEFCNAIAEELFNEVEWDSGDYMLDGCYLLYSAFRDAGRVGDAVDGYIGQFEVDDIPF